MEIVVSGVNQ